MEFGAHCSLEFCSQLDFLPFTCTACKSIYCQTHKFPDSHKCASWSKLDKTLAFCRECGQLLSSQDSKSDSEILSEHLNSNCSIHVYQNPVSLDKCSFQNCKNKCWMIIDCKFCSLLFCIGHRHPKDHKCPLKLEQVKEKQEIKVAKVPLSTSTIRKSSKFNPTVELMKLKSKAIGDSSVPAKDRVYFTILIKDKESIMYFNGNWSIGKMIDKITNQENIQNLNNTTSENKLVLLNPNNSTILQPNETVFNLLKTKEIINAQKVRLILYPKEFKDL